MLVAFVASALGAVAEDEITTLPGLSGPMSSKQYSGYLDLPPTSGGGPAGKHLHYWMAMSESNPATAPTVIWFNGGPGCSSLDGYFYEHGPYHVVEPVVNTSSGVPTLYQNPNRWNQIANVVFLEAPAGVGFSYADTEAGTKLNDTSTAEDNFAALQLLYKGFPELAANDLFISGESYAGAYVPMLALQVLAHNDRQRAVGLGNTSEAASAIPLKGILVGNGVTGQGSIPDAVGRQLGVEFLFGHGLFSSVQMEAITKACGADWAGGDACDAAISDAHATIGNVNVYDIYAPCVTAMGGANEGAAPLPTHLRAPLDVATASLLGRLGGPDGCINAGAATLYLDNAEVQKAIHVTQAKKQWHICGGVDYTSTKQSLLPDYKTTLIPQIRVLIFNGDVDWCVIPRRRAKKKNLVVVPPPSKLPRAPPPPRARSPPPLARSRSLAALAPAAFRTRATSGGQARSACPSQRRGVRGASTNKSRAMSHRMTCRALGRLTFSPSKAAGTWSRNSAPSRPSRCSSA